MRRYVISASVFATILFSCGDSKKTDGDGSGDTSEGTEKTALPVYAIWRPNKNSSPYDGLYDSAARYILICQTQEKVPVEDPSKIEIRSNERCHNQGSIYATISVRRDSLAPVFLTVLDVDSTEMKIVGVTEHNDTIVTSVKDLSGTAFKQLNREFRNTPFKQGEAEKIKQYYSPEKKIENQKKKQRVLRAQPR